MLAKHWILIGALSAFLGVVLGAFGGHVLKESLHEKAFSIYLIGVQYQMYHSLALIGYGLWVAYQQPELASQFSGQLPGWAFTLGILAFSGSLYALALTDVRILGMITPFGGFAFLAGWLGFAYLAWKA